MSEAPIVCAACGGSNARRNRFCIDCGAALDATCRACGADNPARARFCGECGERMRAPQPPADAAGAAMPRPEAYTPRHLAERMLNSRISMEGERKQVTVLFADVAGSTALIRDLDAEAAVARLRPAIDAMMAAAHRHEGLVNRVQGDGVMALFGAPIANEDHAARACLAALEMRDAITALADDALAVRVGLNSGEVVVRAIHNDLTLEYEADGPTVHLAARMEQLAAPGTVRVTRRTFRLAGGTVEARELGALAVKGIDTPVEQVELVRAVDAASRWEIRARRGLTRFVGRAAELGVLDQALALAAEGHGQVVAVAGEPGMGKSRLLHEFLSARVPDSWTVRVTAASSDGSGTPYLPLRTLLRSVIGAEPGEAGEPMAQKVQRFLHGLGPEFAAAGPALRALADVPTEDPAWDRLEPSQRRRRIIDTFKALALHRAARGPLLLAIEDLHWVDAETQAALDALVDSTPGARLLLLVTYRPAYRDPWVGRAWHRRIHLTGLGASGADVLVGALLGDHPSLAALRRALAERTEGRPLFVEETVRALAEEGRIAGAPGAYRLIDAAGEIRIPESVQAVLAARMDRLEPDTKRVLQTASVIGRVVPLPLLEIVCGLPADALLGHVQRLRAGEFLFEHQVVPVPEYLFKHALTENVAYEALLRSRRTALHGAVLDAMQSLHGGGSDAPVEALARHALAGERWDAAVDYLRRAGRKATAQSAYPEARRHLEQALDALAHLPDVPARALTGVDVRLEMRPALGATGRYSDILRRVDEAETLAAAAADADRLQRIRADKIHVLYQLGHCNAAIEVGEKALAAARASGDRAILVQTSANLSQAHFFRGEFRRALEIVEPFAGVLEGVMRHERLGTTATSSCLWLGNMCGAHALLGQFPQALRHAAVARAIANETQRPFDHAMSRAWHGFALLQQGSLDQAHATLSEGYAIASETEVEFARTWLGDLLGAVLLQCGQAAEARSILEEIVALSERLGLACIGMLTRTHLALALHACGDTEAAQRHCERTLQAIRSTGFRWGEPAALAALAHVTAARDGPGSERARTLLRESVALCRAQQAAPQLARALLGLGRLLDAAGLSADARDALTEALALFRRLDIEEDSKSLDFSRRDRKLNDFESFSQSPGPET